MDPVPFVFAQGQVFIDRRFRVHAELLHTLRKDRGIDAFDDWINAERAQLGLAWVDGDRLASFELHEFVPRPFRMRDEGVTSQEEWQRDEPSPQTLQGCEQALIDALRPR